MKVSHTRLYTQSVNVKVKFFFTFGLFGLKNVILGITRHQIHGPIGGKLEIATVLEGGHKNHHQTSQGLRHRN